MASAPDIRDVDDLFPRRTACRCRRPQRGRGAIANPDPRFAAWTRTSVDDGWLRDDDTAPATELFVDSAKRMLSHNDSPDLPFEQSLNPYRGCEHGCIYCYARPSHAFLGHSPGLDFETKLYLKPEAARLLRRELTRPDYVCRPIAIGTNTDAWQPVERRLRITRSVLELLLELKHPAMLITQSALIERDNRPAGSNGEGKSGACGNLADHARPRTRPPAGTARLRTRRRDWPRSAHCPAPGFRSWP